MPLIDKTKDEYFPQINALDGKTRSQTIPISRTEQKRIGSVAAFLPYLLGARQSQVRPRRNTSWSGAAPSLFSPAVQFRSPATYLRTVLAWRRTGSEAQCEKQVIVWENGMDGHAADNHIYLFPRWCSMSRRGSCRLPSSTCLFFSTFLILLYFLSYSYVVREIINFMVERLIYINSLYISYTDCWGIDR